MANICETFEKSYKFVNVNVILTIYQITQRQASVKNPIPKMVQI